MPTGDKNGKSGNNVKDDRDHEVGIVSKGNIREFKNVINIKELT